MTEPSHGLRVPMVVLALACATGTMLILVFRLQQALATYGAGTVPLGVAWLAAVMIVVVAMTGLTRSAASSGATALVAGSVVLTAWSDGALLFDALRIVRLVPLPLNGWGFALRLLLLVGTGLGAWPVVVARRVRQGRCPACRRWRPGPLARIPRWVAVVGVVFALPYPVLRVTWLLGGTLGTTGGPVQVDPTLQLVMATAGVLLLTLATVLMIDRGPTWLRALLGWGGVGVGALLAVTFAPAAIGTLDSLMTSGLGWSPGSDLMGWVFALFYVSWTVCGLATALSGLRYWVHRRMDCPTCRPVTASSTRVRTSATRMAAPPAS